MARYLVTGGTGFIGAALVRKLVAGGHTVRVFDNNSRGAPRRLGKLATEIELIEGDIRDFEKVKRAAKGIESCLHLVYVNGTEFFYTHPELVLDVGIRGMLSVLDACRAEGVRELVLASSSEVYQLPSQVPTPEEVALIVPDVHNPRYSYGGGKIACELMALNYGRTGFERVMIFRPHNVYGPDMGWEHVLPQFIMRAAEATAKHPKGPVPFPILGDGSQTRAFVHVEDLADGVLAMLARGDHMQIYHIGNPVEVTIGSIAERVLRHMGREPTIVPGRVPPGETPRRCPDISKLRALGFAPKISLDQGLPGMIDWYLSNLHLRPDGVAETPRP
jgi:dTDP-glucose 4,6-dehydratase/UDP-glucose 4-epimerase